MTRWRFLVLLSPAVLGLVVCAPLLVPRKGYGFQPLHHRYDSLSACNELIAQSKPQIRGGMVPLPLRWWHLAGWRSQLYGTPEAGTYMWVWYSSVPAAPATVRVRSACGVERHEHLVGKSDWTLSSWVQVVVDANDRPITSFSDICVAHPERCQ
jgi:hypothetical protein